MTEGKKYELKQTKVVEFKACLIRHGQRVPQSRPGGT